MFKSSPIHPHFSIRVHNIRLNDIIDESGYAEIRNAFETNSLLNFACQCSHSVVDVKLLQSPKLTNKQHDRFW